MFTAHLVRSVACLVLFAAARIQCIAGLTPGITPNWTTTEEPPQQGVSSAVGYEERAIARWTTPGYSVYAATKTVGVLAFHISGLQFRDEGIAKVEFVANNGAPFTVTQPSINPETGRWEWWVALESLPTDGIVEVRAVVYPHAGRCRVLQGAFTSSVGYQKKFPTTQESLLLWSNRSNTYSRIPRYVSPQGSDIQGDGSIGKPYATIAGALSSGFNNLADHSTIYLQAGSYSMPRRNDSTQQNSSGWCTICPAPGVSRDQVVIDKGDSTENSRLLLIRLKDVTLDRSKGEGPALIRGISSMMKACVWLEGCDVIGAGSTSSFSGTAGVVDNGSAVGILYITNSENNRLTWRGWNSGPSWAGLVLGVDVRDCTGDVFSGSVVVRDFTVKDHVMVEGQHPDLWQSYAAGTNRLMVDGSVRNTNAQLFFFDNPKTDNTDIAVINVTMQKSSASIQLSQLASAKHMLIWHCQLVNQQFRLNAFTDKNLGIDKCETFSLHGNLLFSLAYQAAGGVTRSQIENLPGFMLSDNSFTSSDWAPGSGSLIGDPQYGSLETGDFRAKSPGATYRTVRWDEMQQSRLESTARGSFHQATPPTPPRSLRLRSK